MSGQPNGIPLTGTQEAASLLSDFAEGAPIGPDSPPDDAYAQFAALRELEERLMIEGPEGAEALGPVHRLGVIAMANTTLMDRYLDQTYETDEEVDQVAATSTSLLGHINATLEMSDHPMPEGLDMLRYIRENYLSRLDAGIPFVARVNLEAYATVAHDLLDEDESINPEELLREVADGYRYAAAAIMEIDHDTDRLSALHQRAGPLATEFLEAREQ
jgi:hypothetical protein